MPEFFASLEAQTYGLEKLEVILVDDGSTDSTTNDLAVAFSEKHSSSVTYLRKENGGQASARNLGLLSATGEWVTFPDPDDLLNKSYFAEIAAALHQTLKAGERIDVISARLLLWHPETQEPVRDNHALAKRFHHGILIKDLDSEPDWIQPHVTSGFVKREMVERRQIAFPEELRYRFEDGCFISEYLLHFDSPKVLFVPKSEYFYRQRADNSSTMQSSRGRPETYVKTISVGFTHLIKKALELRGRVPRWLQTLMLYDQFWILKASQAGELRRTRFPEEMYDELAILLPSFLDHIDSAAIAEFAIMPVLPWMKEVLLALKTGNASPIIYVGAHDKERGLRAYLYRYAGPCPSENFTVSGRRIQPVFAKNSALEYLGRPIGWQRTLWFYDHEAVTFSIASAQIFPISQPPKTGSPYLGSIEQVSPKRNRWAQLETRLRSLGEAVRRRTTPGWQEYVRLDLVLRLRIFRRRYKDAWVFIDRDTDANDSAEDLYRWVIQNHPEINAWFIIRKNSADWQRLKSAGFRLIPYASVRHWAALSNAQHLASSHADRFVSHSVPPRIRRRYKFTFLQHGVIKGDISSWLNPKSIDLFVTSTKAEYDYVTGDSPFRFGTKEVRLTGLPRHDALRLLSQPQKSKILLMPTWRDYLVGSMQNSSLDRELAADFRSSAFAREWATLISSEEFASASKDYEVVFMPHPNMQGYLDYFDLPPNIQLGSYADTDLRPLLAEAKLLVTDYSSMAFNAAYLNVPTIYFQFDREEYFKLHTERPGYFHYEHDGFGPVCSDSAEVVQQTRRLLTSELPEYIKSRIHEAFPKRDGNNAARVFEAMKSLYVKHPRTSSSE